MDAKIKIKNLPDSLDNLFEEYNIPIPEIIMIDLNLNPVLEANLLTAYGMILMSWALTQNDDIKTKYFKMLSAIGGSL